MGHFASFCFARTLYEGADQNITAMHSPFKAMCNPICDVNFQGDTADNATVDFFFDFNYGHVAPDEVNYTDRVRKLGARIAFHHAKAHDMLWLSKHFGL